MKKKSEKEKENYINLPPPKKKKQQVSAEGENERNRRQQDWDNLLCENCLVFVKAGSQFHCGRMVRRKKKGGIMKREFLSSLMITWVKKEVEVRKKRKQEHRCVKETLYLVFFFQKQVEPYNTRKEKEI